MSLTIAASSFILLGVLVAVLRPRWIIDHAWVVLGVLSCVSAGSLVALIQPSPFAIRIQVDPSEERLIPRGDPAQKTYQQAVLNFGDDDLYMIVMESHDIFTTESLSALRRISDAISRIPGVRSTESVVDVFSYHYDAEWDSVSIGRFIDRIPGDPEKLADLKQRALEDPIYSNLLVSKDGRAAAINVAFQKMSDREFIEARLDEKILGILKAETEGGRRFYVTGRPHIKSQGYHMMVRDLLRLTPIAIFLSAAVVWFFTNTTRSTLITLTACGTSTLWVFGALALLQHPLNLITLSLSALLISIGSVYPVHVLARFERLAASANSSREAAYECLCSSRVPVVIAGTTTIIAFSALLIANIPGVNDLGAFGALGVASITLISLTGLPALMALLPKPEAAGWLGSETAGGTKLARAFGGMVDRWLSIVAGWSAHHSGRILACWGVATVISLSLIPRIVIDTDYLTFFREDSDVRQDFQEVNRLMAGAVPIYLIVAGDKEGAFRDPTNLHVLEDLQHRVEGISGVTATMSVVDFIRTIRRASGENGHNGNGLPQNRMEVAEYMFLIPKEKLRRFANSNHSSVNILVRTGELGSAALKDLRQELALETDRAPLPPAFRPTVTGSAFLLNLGADRIAGNQLATVSAAAFAILILVSWIFRSPRVGLLSMIPNIVPVIIFFGLLGAGVAPLSLPTSLIGCIVLGIAVDDTVHFLVTYRRHRKNGADPAEASTLCLRQVGRPIFITSMMLCVGFSALLLSGFATLQEFGQLTAMTMLICLCTDLLLLPAVLNQAKV